MGSNKKSKKSPKKKSLVKDEPLDLAISKNDDPVVRMPEELPTKMIPIFPTDEKIEVWFHETCLIWAPGVCLIPPRLIGLDEAVSDSQQVVL